LNQFPASRYVVIDDEPKVLEAAKRHRKGRAATIIVCQGKHAEHARYDSVPFEPDLAIGTIAELLESRHRRVLEQF